MKTIFLSYCFPPQAAPRAVQVARLAQYSRLNIRVLCASTPPPELALRKDVEVIGFPDTSSRWWRRAKQLFYLPDSERPWAERLAKTILTNGLVARDDVLVTFGQPMSDHLAGLRVKRQLGLPWIAHFSDPWSDNPYLFANPVLRFWLRKLERQVVEAADRLLFTSSETVDLVMAKYPATLRKKASVLPHAFDPLLPEHVARREPDGMFVLRYLGNFYGQRNPRTFVKGVALLHQAQPEILGNVRIEIIGRWVGHERWSTGKWNLPPGLLTVRKSVSYEESLRLMHTSDALLIIDAPFTHNVFFPSKLVDYLSARRPILALTPPGTSANIVAASGGVLASPETPESIAAGLAEMITQFRSGSIHAPPEEMVEYYDARRVAEIFDNSVQALRC